ncbi:MAG: GTPase HflX, partial [Candidatus Saganbacteria bacterium]|nr:GTPase HflX [Candidatus Saganbacteria bacterium]
MEKAVLVGIKFRNEILPLSESLEELKKLADSAGAKAAAVLTQTKDRPDQRYCIGSGKLVELQALCESVGADLVIFDHEITPSQSRNLEEALNVKVIDRTELIIDIFSQHAHTREGKLQVRLAQSVFLLSHLSGHRTSLSRLGGGIGTRGPGETKLETDRRKVRKDISVLKKELEKVKNKRQLLRTRRKSSRMKVAALIGYTNSGKSTLLNSLTNANVLSEDKLFATLDPVTRRRYLKDRGETILLTDTVGFIQKLPLQLISAFRATLEETIEADLLLHVIDASSEFAEHQIESVYTTLEELKILNTPVLNIFNKIDKAGKDNL